MKVVDQVYTPSSVATTLVDAATKRAPGIICDFTAGDGALLEFASRRWPHSEIAANDIDQNATKRIRRRHPQWYVTNCDFLENKSINRSPYLKKLVARCSLILLNPPFSYRGWQCWEVILAGRRFYCSRSLAFVLRSCGMLAHRGQLVAVLPAGSLTSTKDADAWEWLRQSYEVELLAEYDKRTFAGVYPRTVLARITRDSKRAVAEETSLRSVEMLRLPSDLKVTVVRGWIPMHTLSRKREGSWLPLFHNKELGAEGGLLNSGVIRSPVHVSGPGVLLPRVGQPSTSNLSVLPPGRDVALSDCIIALLTRTATEAAILKEALVRCWTEIEVHYGGTCAKYITLEKLGLALERCGFENLEFLEPKNLASVWMSTARTA